MKVLYPLLTVMLSGLALGASAQAVSVGPRLGVNVSNMAVKPYNIGTPLGAEAVTHFEDTRGTIVGLQGGIMVNVAFEDFFSLQPELNFSQKGVKQSGTIEGLAIERTAVERELKLNYLEVPVLFKFSTGTEQFRASLFAGPYFGYLLGGTDEFTMNGKKAHSGDLNFEFDKNDSLYHFNRFDFGGTIGVSLGYKTDIGTFLVDARYNVGVKEAITYHPSIAETSLRLTNRTVGVSIGWLYHFPFTPKVKDYGDLFDEEEGMETPSPTPQQGTPQQ